MFSICICLSFFVFVILFFGYSSKDFKLDASSDTLILENDEDLKKYQEITDIYSTNEFLITTITSQQKIIKDEISPLINFSLSKPTSLR